MCKQRHRNTLNPILNGTKTIREYTCIRSLFTFTDLDSDSDPHSDPISVQDLELGLESESNSIQCEKFYVVKCSHLVCSQNQYLYPAI